MKTITLDAELPVPPERAFAVDPGPTAVLDRQYPVTGGLTTGVPCGAPTGNGRTA